jgi:threonine/homoserine/homoserine lactone efflux protein
MDLSTFVVAVVLLEVTPGPNMAYLATMALSRGRAAGLVATAGVAFGLSVHAIVGGLGAGALISNTRCSMMCCVGSE